MYLVNMYEKFAPGSGVSSVPQRVQTCEVVSSEEKATQHLKEIVSQWERMGYIKKKTREGREILTANPELGENGYYIFFNVEFEKDNF